MPDFCTCGAKLPEDARFCHKCGKPQREEPLLVEEEVAAPPQLPPRLELPVAPPLPPIGFHNKIAVRVAMLTGILGFWVSALTGPVAPLFMVACGFFSVYWYRRRAGEPVSWISGAHLGWITGLFGFLMATVLVTLAALALSQPDMAAMMKEQLKALSRPDAEVTEIIETFSTPAKLASVLSIAFLLFTIPPAAGGAMGAYLMNRNSQSG